MAEVQDLEDRYEKSAFKGVEGEVGRGYKLLLPIKTKDGVIQTRTHLEQASDEQDESIADEEENYQGLENESDDQEAMDVETAEPVSTVQLLAQREEILKSRRYAIGILSSDILEDPTLKSKNFSMLFEFMEEKNPEVYITVRKLATVSLLEVFKDLLPSYQITDVKQDGIKLKKETLQLRNVEVELLRNYKNYLQKLEKMAKVLHGKTFSSRKVDEKEIQWATLAVSCMSELLQTHPYFNFSTNIVNFIIPLLDSKYVFIREAVLKCLTQVLKEDKLGELSLTIVRRVNQYIKSKKNLVHPEVLLVLLGLRMKDINLDKEKEEEMKQKKLMSHKQRILALSKRERKKSKQLKQVENELLETKAEENKMAKHKIFTEITSVTFTIFFRILKQAPNSKILSACLEGLSKFAHCINLEFYQDIVNVLNRLLDEENLDLRQRLNCIQTVFVILSCQGSALNIDPHRFYVHLYKDLLNVHAGKSHSEIDVVVQSLVQAVVGRHKNITKNLLLAFVKRLATMALSLQHNGALSVLGVVKTKMQLGSAAHVILDTDSGFGDGLYLAELEEPEYCNAQSTALWELAALQRHYHSTVQQFAKNIAWQAPSSGEGSLDVKIAKLSPQELLQEFEPAEVVFKPAIPIPKKITCKATTSHKFASSELETYINRLCK